MEKVKVYKNKDFSSDLDFGQMPRIRDEFIAQLENALMILSFNQSNIYHSEIHADFNLSTFDGAWLIDSSLNDEMNDFFCFTPYGELQADPTMFPDLNMKTMSLGGELASMEKFRILNTKEKRHLDKRYRFFVSHRAAILDNKEQKWWTVENGYGVKNDAEKGINYLIPTSINPGYYVADSAAKEWIAESLNDKEHSWYLEANNKFNLALNLRLSFYYQWSCYIKEEGAVAGIRMPIHPDSIKDVFAMRDVPEGKKRRASIINFVKEHYRTVNIIDEEKSRILIKKHFRGELKFRWRGLEVRITPSEYDLNRVKTKKKIKRF